MAGFREAQGDLVLEHVTKSFTTFTAVDDLSLTVPRGSFFALLGPSGCGKTTTLRMVAGLEQPTSGTIRIGNTDLTGSRPYERPVNTVFQSYALFPHLSVRDNVAFGPKRRGVKDALAQADATLSLVQLTHLAGRKPTQLSGGQQQRVAVARALVGKPSILLADEPTGNLDSKNGEAVMALLDELHKGGATICMVTHDPRYAEFAGRKIFMFDGRVVDEETLHRLRKEEDARLFKRVASSPSAGQAASFTSDGGE